MQAEELKARIIENEKLQAQVLSVFILCKDASVNNVLCLDLWALFKAE